MNRVQHFVFVATVELTVGWLAAERAAAFDSYDGRSGSQPYYPSQQYAPSQSSYQQSYNSNSSDSSRQQYGYGRQSTYGFGYQPQQQYEPPQSVGSPTKQQYDSGRSVAPTAAGSGSGTEGEPRRPRRRHRWVTRNGPANGQTGIAAHPLRRSALGRGAWVVVRSAVQPSTGTPAQQGGGPNANGQIAACVRTCDGYFFPMGLGSDQTSIEGQRSLCTALCPGAKTDLYFIPQGADGITAAVNAMGSPYSRMPRALRYTKARDAACSCHGTGSRARLVSLMKDFTMRRGDAVMTVNGVLVFKGAWRWPYRLSDFQVLDKSQCLSEQRPGARLPRESVDWRSGGSAPTQQSRRGDFGGGRALHVHQGQQRQVGPPRRRSAVLRTDDADTDRTDAAGNRILGEGWFRLRSPRPGAVRAALILVLPVRLTRPLR